MAQATNRAAHTAFLVRNGTETSFASNFPRKFTRDDASLVWRGVTKVFEAELDSIVGEIDAFAALYDYLSVNARYLPYLAQKLGWRLDTSSPISIQRKITGLLVPLYKRRGTAPGVVDILNLLLGIQVKIVEPWASGWRLNVDALGSTTTLAAGITTPYGDPRPYTFYVVFPRALNDSERAAALALVDYMKRAETHFRLVEPPPTVQNPFILGVSRLGVDYLAKGPSNAVSPPPGDAFDDWYASYLGEVQTYAVSSSAQTLIGPLLPNARYSLEGDVAMCLRQGNPLVVVSQNDFVLLAETPWPLTISTPLNRYLAVECYVAPGALTPITGTLRVTRVDTEVEW